jgi:hypothetical protein
MESKLYDLNDKYYTSHCDYTDSIITENREVEINWPLNISKIILLSKQDKTVKLNIAETILNEEKKETVYIPINKSSSSSSSSSSLREHREHREHKEHREHREHRDTDDYESLHNEHRDTDDYESLHNEHRDTDGYESLHREHLYESKIQESCNDIISFWQTIEVINWYDKDEKILGKFSISNKFNRITRTHLFDMLNNIILPILKKKLSLLLALVDIENHNNILTHIVMKGQAFHDFIILNPDVSFYLVDQFYPAYDWLH